MNTFTFQSSEHIKHK